MTRVTGLLMSCPQAHARLMARHQVTQQDAVVAVAIMDAGHWSGGDSSLGLPDALHSHFAAEPEAEYRDLERRVLLGLGLLPLLQAGGHCGAPAPAGGSWLR